MVQKSSTLILLLFFSIIGYTQTPNWKVNEGAFQQTETMICKLSVNGGLLESPNDMVAAFIGGECRGVAKPVYIASVNKYLTYLTIFSNTQGDSVTFKLYKSSTNQIFDAVNKIAFKINENLGSTFQTYRVSNTKLSSAADLLSFKFSNVDFFKVIPNVDAITGQKINNYYIPQNANKASLIPSFTVSPNASVFVLESPIVSGVTNIDFTNNKTIQILSEDESTLNNYTISVKNFLICSDSIKYAPIITKDQSNNLVSSSAYGNIWLKDNQLISDTTKLIKPISNGSYKSRVMYGECISAVSNSYYYLLTDIINIDNSQYLNIFPNPFVQDINVDFRLNNYSKISISIRELFNGNLVYQNNDVYKGSKIQPLHLSPGLYVLNASTIDGKYNYQFKLIKL